jgi:hypothetical protein
MKQMGSGIAYFFDVKSAFGSVVRSRAFKDLLAKMPGEVYLEKLQRCFDSLEMNIDLGFYAVKGVDILRG